MKKIILTTLLLASLSTNVFPAVIYQDNYNDGASSNLTFAGSANWSENSGQLKSVGGGGTSVALFDGIITPEVFKLEADVQLLSSGDYGHVGLVWGYNNLSDFNTSYLRTHWDHVTSWSYPRGSNPERILATPGIINQVSYHLSLEIDSIIKEMTISLDGFSTTFTGADFDILNQNSGGSIGLLSWGQNASFDNVVLTTPVPEPSVFALMSLGLAALGFTARRRKEA